MVMAIADPPIAAVAGVFSCFSCAGFIACSAAVATVGPLPEISTGKHVSKLQIAGMSVATVSAVVSFLGE